jgi:hypothetical protein
LGATIARSFIITPATSVAVLIKAVGTPFL